MYAPGIDDLFEDFRELVAALNGGRPEVREARGQIFGDEGYQMKIIIHDLDPAVSNRLFSKKICV